MATDEIGTPVDNNEVKGNKKVKPMRFLRANQTDSSTQPDIGLKTWQETPTPPTEEAHGTSGSGANIRAWIVVCGPVADEEENRVECNLNYAPLSNSNPPTVGTKVIIETGGSGYPFDGSPFTISNLVRGPYRFEAWAKYNNNVEKSAHFDITL